MNFSNDQFVATQKSNMDAFVGFTEKAFSSFEKVVELNMAASKALLGESMSNLQALMAVKDVQAFMAVQTQLVQPMNEKSAAYSRHLYDIMSEAGADLTQTIEATTAESQKAVTTLLETSLKNAPAGSEAAVAVIKSAMTAGTNAVETAQKSAKQALKAVDSSITSNIDAVAAAGQKA